MSNKDASTIRNEVINILIKRDFPSNNQLLDEAHLLYQYNCELESGGHESFLRWQSQYIEEIGITAYLEKLIGILKKINAADYADILEEFGEKMWNLYLALENGEIHEDEFYEIIHEADKRYYGLEDKIYFLIENHFVELHAQVIDIKK